ncbi:uncharacterized protein LOC115204424 isoform X2 [Salmo trutta]|uniref:uncharacterized protein LOC115204424 isoform X2 n=1 Tax=Salmo trutta TaxID=8032 RepID=UPI0011308360|nr:uncharacterized protein LOC115204424 isoform X2 [Salmo trutta]
MAALNRPQTKMYPFSLLFVFLVLPYQAWLACPPIKKMVRCEDLRTANGYVYLYETPAGSGIEVYSNNTPIAYRGMNKPFDANVSDKVIRVNNSAVILSECLNLTFTFFHVLQGMVEECHLHYIVAEREHEAVTTITLTDDLTDTSDDMSGNGDKATSHTKEITAGVLVILVLLLGIAGLLMYRYGCIPWRDKHRFALAQPAWLGRDYLNTNRENQRDNGDPDDPAAEDAESLRSVLVVGRDQGDGVEEEREPPHSQETHVESSLLNGHLVNSQGERGEPSERFVQPMGSEGTDTEFSQKRHAGFPLVNGNHKARVNDETKEPTTGAQSPGPPQMNGGPPMSDRLENNPVGQRMKKTALVNKQDQDWSTMA